jgi:hypothetical protein
MIPLIPITAVINPINPFTADPNPFHASLISCCQVKGGDIFTVKSEILVILVTDALVGLKVGLRFISASIGKVCCFSTAASGQTLI